MLQPILLALTNVADAVPLQITQQGRMLDPDGAPCGCYYRIWYFGPESYGFLGTTADYAGKTANSCTDPDGDWY